MIMAKAKNTELTELYASGTDKWVKWVGSKKTIFFTEEDNYFLCHPKHTEACLHWLNGGKVVVMASKFNSSYVLGANDGHKWDPEHIFMFENVEFTIEVKKREKWIIYRTDGSIVGPFDKKPENITGSGPFDKKPENITGSGQIIRIEVV
jgi:hypothetical protein